MACLDSNRAGGVTLGPQLSEYMHGGVMTHVLTRSVRDSAAMLDATHGPEVGSHCAGTTGAALPGRGLACAGAVEGGFQHPVASGAGVDPSAVASVERTVALLRDLGHEVEEAPARY